MFQDVVRMNYPAVIDKTHVMMCEVKPTPMFGIECKDGLDVSKIQKMKIEDECFDVSIENGRYVLKNEARTYSFLLTDAESLNKPNVPKLDSEGVIETDAKTLLNAVEKCILVFDYCTVQNGRMSAKNDVADVSVVLGKDDGSGCRSCYALDYLKKIAKVMVGDVRIYFDTNYPMKMCWFDGYCEYSVFLAPRIDDKGEKE